MVDIFFDSNIIVYVCIILVNVPNGKDMSSNHSIDEKQKLQEDTDDSPVSPTLEPALQDIDFTLEKVLQIYSGRDLQCMAGFT